jgi:peroxiredoxin
MVLGRPGGLPHLNERYSEEDMASTESVMAGLGTAAPEFTLPDVVSGGTVNLAWFAGKKGLLAIFISRHCPYVQHVKHELARLGRDYRDQDLGIVAISSNYVPQYPDDSPESLREMAAELAIEFPICYDESQEAAKAYQAACTPDFFLYDQSRHLVYRGQLDGSRPKNNIPVTGADLRAAIDALMTGRPIQNLQRPSLGCNIKWRPGNEPAYYRG